VVDNVIGGRAGSSREGSRGEAVFEGRMLAREATRYWWVVLLAGIAWLVIGWLVLRANVTSLKTVGVLLGVVFVLAGVTDAGLAALVGGGWKVLYYIMAVIFVLAGLWAFIRPVNTFFALVSVLGLLLLFYGAFEIVRGIASRDETPYWWLGLVTGVLLILLAFWVSGSDRVYDLRARTFLILFWVGLMALIRGFTDIVLAFSIRRAGQALTAA